MTDGAANGRVRPGRGFGAWIAAKGDGLRRSFGFVCVALGLGMAGALLLAGGAAASVPDGAISGTVTDEATGEPLVDVCVSVYTLDWDLGGSGSTASDGSYRVDGLGTGQYKVEFYDCSWPSRGYLDEWYDNRPHFDTADPVAVAEGQETSGINAALALGGSIAGTLTDSATGLPAPGVCVGVHSSRYASTRTYTDPLGRYAAEGLATGSYRVEFSECFGLPGPLNLLDRGYLTEWYDDQPDYDHADPVAVTQGQDTSGVDAALAVGGSISGTVTDEAAGLPLDDVCVAVVDTAAEWDWAGGDRSDALGRYSVRSLDQGDYKVGYFDCSYPDRGYLSEWYDDRVDFASADVVPVARGQQTSGIDAALAIGGSISGRITNEATGEGLDEVCVDLIGDGWSWHSAYTDSRGMYTVTGLRTGNYKVSFTDCAWPDRGYVREWYNDKADFTTADPVPVTEGQETSGIDAALVVGGSINGTVTDESTGDPVPDTCVDVYPVAGGWGSRGQTDAGGHYTVGGLRTGDYKVAFSDCAWPKRYLGEWYDDQPDFDSADRVAVTQGQETPGVDAALALGGSIRGTVTVEATGDPLANVCVDVRTPSGEWAGWGWTDGSGRYTVGGLRTGHHKVSFTDCSWPERGYIGEWYDDQPDFASADRVAVTQGQETPGIDAALAIGGSIAGTVTDETTGEPLDGVCVGVQSAGGDWVSWAITDSSGSYEARGLRAGDHKVRFSDCGWPGRGYATEWYDDRFDAATADPVAVIQPHQTAGIDAALGFGGSIRGTVVDEGTGDPLGDVCVDVHTASGEWRGWGFTDSTGSYSVPGLRAGSYKVQFSDCGWPARGYRTEWYDDRPNLQSADEVPVATGVDASGVDAALALDPACDPSMENRPPRCDGGGGIARPVPAPAGGSARSVSEPPGDEPEPGPVVPVPAVGNDPVAPALAALQSEPLGQLTDSDVLAF